jgi:hypothetical protein
VTKRTSGNLLGDGTEYHIPHCPTGRPAINGLSEINRGYYGSAIAAIRYPAEMIAKDLAS